MPVTMADVTTVKRAPIVATPRSVGHGTGPTGGSAVPERDGDRC